MMKVIICTLYGSPEVLAIVDIPKPTPKTDELLIAFTLARLEQRIGGCIAWKCPMDFACLRD